MFLYILPSIRLCVQTGEKHPRRGCQECPHKAKKQGFRGFSAYGRDNLRTAGAVAVRGYVRIRAGRLPPAGIFRQLPPVSGSTPGGYRFPGCDPVRVQVLGTHHSMGRGWLYPFVKILTMTAKFAIFRAFVSQTIIYTFFEFKRKNETNVNSTLLIAFNPFA